MLSFLAPNVLMTKSGFSNGFNYIRSVIMMTHQDPLLLCFRDAAYMGKEAYFHLQILHLVARPAYVPLLEYVMAAYAVAIVSKPRYLLAMDMERDYRGETVTPRDFNEDAYEVAKLFHRRPVPVDLFAIFVRPGATVSREREYMNLKRKKLHSDIRKMLDAKEPVSKKARKPLKPRNTKVDAPLRQLLREAPEETDDLVQALFRIRNGAIRRNQGKVVRAVAIAQSFRLLAAALDKFQEATGTNSMDYPLMRAFLSGQYSDDGGSRPAEALNAIAQWG